IGVRTDDGLGRGCFYVQSVGRKADAQNRGEGRIDDRRAATSDDGMNRRSLKRKQGSVGTPRYSGAHLALIYRDYRFDLPPRHLRKVVNEFIAFGAKPFLLVSRHSIPIG